MSPRTKPKEYSVSLDRAGTVSAEGCESLDLGDTWTADHLVLAGLARCSVASLLYHARRATLEAAASASAPEAVGARDDRSWGLLEIECELNVELDPAPAGDELRTLLEKAEHGCFVGSSLTPRPSYRWCVNGDEVAT